jgi:hypothetical protein
MEATHCRPETKEASGRLLLKAWVCRFVDPSWRVSVTVPVGAVGAHDDLHVAV